MRKISFKRGVTAACRLPGAGRALLYGAFLFGAAPALSRAGELFPHRLGSYTTWYESGSARAENIVRAAGLLDGLVLQPGAEFSFNESVTWRIPRSSLAPAPALVGGQLLDAPGGGLCQVSSTLYAAALHAGLEIRSRRAHSSPVDYISPGLDATVSSVAGIDLLLGQPLPFPVLVDARAERGVLRVSLRGARRPEGVCRVVVRGPFREGRWLEAAVERVFRAPGREPVTELVSRDRYLAGAPEGEGVP